VRTVDLYFHPKFCAVRELLENVFLLKNFCLEVQNLKLKISFWGEIYGKSFFLLEIAAVCRKFAAF